MLKDNKIYKAGENFMLDCAIGPFAPEGYEGFPEITIIENWNKGITYDLSVKMDLNTCSLLNSAEEAELCEQTNESTKFVVSEEYLLRKELAAQASQINQLRHEVNRLNELVTAQQNKLVTPQKESS